ncbi:hypothetical protein JHK87_057313 [Glycine soja]|nr:hypothetical protein JHK87_057313 [Glycine soja]
MTFIIIIRSSPPFPFSPSPIPPPHHRTTTVLCSPFFPFSPSSPYQNNPPHATNRKQLTSPTTHFIDPSSILINNDNNNKIINNTSGLNRVKEGGANPLGRWCDRDAATHVQAQSPHVRTFTTQIHLCARLTTTTQPPPTTTSSCIAPPSPPLCGHR